MKYLMTIVLLAAISSGAVAQESHSNKGGVYWSRVRNVDDASISNYATTKDSTAQYKEFKRLCSQAYEAFEDGDYYATAILGDSALSKQFFTPELLYYMGVSLEKLECYNDAEIAYRKAMKAGYSQAATAFVQYQHHMEQLKALDKLNKKEAKRKGEAFVPLSQGKTVPEPMEVKRAPKLQLINNSLRFDGLTADGAIRAGTTCKLCFSMRNTGNAPTGMCEIMLGDKSDNDFLNIGIIPPTVIKKRSIITVEIPIEADKRLGDGEVDLLLLIDEPNGYGLPPRHFKLKTQK